MSWPDLSPLVEADLEEAAQWYEDRQAGLGDAFLDAVLELLRRIFDHPQHFPRLHKDARRAVLTRRFPFSVYFRERGEGIEVLAILHDARDPEEWRRRFRSKSP
ncbi:MAG: type II toxin-antitoxin system RelE/ParE family toxin [Acidobacteria bacterium]|nr:type II toxin-antitoxin system RelE/ParE family toxin [Acidobacteriota bacterium]